MSGQPKKNWRRLAPGILISAASLVIIFLFVDLNRFLQAVQLADFRFIGLLFVVTLMWLLVRSAVWQTLLVDKKSGKQPPFGKVFLTLNEGYVLNNLLPFRLGEVGRAFLLSKKTDLGFLQVLSTILIERALDVAMAAGLLLVTLPFVVQTGFAAQAALATGGAVVAVLGLLYLLARNQIWALRQYDNLAKRITILQKLFNQQQLTAFFSGLDALTNPRRFLKVISLMTLNWGVALLQFYILLKAYFPQAEILWAAFTLSVMAMGIAAPSSPGAIGVLEISIMGALSAFNLDPSASLAVALTAHLTNYLTTGVIGTYALAHDGLTLSGLYRDVRQISHNEESPVESNQACLEERRARSKDIQQSSEK